MFLVLMGTIITQLEIQPLDQTTTQDQLGANRQMEVPPMEQIQVEITGITGNLFYSYQAQVAKASFPPELHLAA